jgi:hypothetical protein
MIFMTNGCLSPNPQSLKPRFTLGFNIVLESKLGFQMSKESDTAVTIIYTLFILFQQLFATKCTLCTELNLLLLYRTQGYRTLLEMEPEPQNYVSCF